MTLQTLTVLDLLHAARGKDPQATAIIAPDCNRQLSYDALSSAVRALAAEIAEAAGRSKHRARIGLVLPNGLGMSVALLASAISGTATPFNPDLTVAEYERYFTATRIDLLILQHNENGPVTTAAAALGLPILRLTPDFTLQGITATAPVAPPDPEDVAMVLMTSGSTGVPKIVPLSHRNVCRSAQDVAQSLSLGPADRCLAMWQQFHIGGLVDLLLAPLSASGTLIVTPGFDAAEFFSLSARLAPTWFQGVPTSLGELLRYADRQNIDGGADTLRFVRSVAAALTPNLQAELETFFNAPIVRTLGMTEAGPLITSTQLPPSTDKPGSVGRPSGPDLCIFDADGQPVTQGAVGDIGIRGENVFEGYENNSKANAASFRDGWFLTGDRGFLDADGDLFLSGRTSEQINRGGYKIMPAEVEEALSRHAEVSEASVFGLAHPTLGEDVAAAVVLTPDANANSSELRAHLSTILSTNKIPGQVLIRDALPRNPVGKVDRMALAMDASTTADASALLVPPSTPTQQCIADIWCRELELPEIGIRQDFMIVGGDSLSALRVIVAMEAAFGQAMPERVFENLTTIEDVARILDEAGICLSENADPVAADPVPVEQPRSTKLSEVTECECLDVLQKVVGKPELDLTLRQMVVYRTPAQIDALLTDVPAREVGKKSASMVQRPRLFWRFTKKRSEILNEINAWGPATHRWRREELTASAMLYRAPDVPSWDKTLIVGFSGNGQGMSSEMYRFLLPLDPERFDFVLLRTSSRWDLYLDGLQDMGESIVKLGAWLEEFADTEGYAGRMVLGTSGGALGAIHAGITFGYDRIVAMCPPRLSKHQGYEPLFEALRSTPAAVQSTVLLTNGQLANDVDAVRQLQGYLPDAQHDFHPECPKHNLLNFAREKGQLAPLYARWFDDGPKVASLDPALETVSA